MSAKALATFAGANAGGARGPSVNSCEIAKTGFEAADAAAGKSAETLVARVRGP